jgi:hypothetical protein
MSKPRHPKLVAREAQAIDGIMDVEIMGLPSSILNALREAGIYTIEQLNFLTEDELYRTMRDSGLGCVAVDKILDYTKCKASGGATLYDPNQ